MKTDVNRIGLFIVVMSLTCFLQAQGIQKIDEIDNGLDLRVVDDDHCDDILREMLYDEIKHHEEDVNDFLLQIKEQYEWRDERVEETKNTNSAVIKISDPDIRQKAIGMVEELGSLNNEYFYLLKDSANSAIKEKSYLIKAFDSYESCELEACMFFIRQSEIQRHETLDLWEPVVENAARYDEINEALQEILKNSK